MSSGAVVTVILPGLNVAGFAQEAIDSLLAQRFQAWEAVLVDDASTDGTGALFDAAAAADPRFRVIHHPRTRGLGAARNAGLRTVTTPFVGFLDADDVMLPGALERLVGVVDDSGSDFVVGAYVRLRPDAAGGYVSSEIQPWVEAATSPAAIGVTIEQRPETSGNIVAWSKLSRTSFWTSTGIEFPEDSWYEDQVVAQQMYVHARRFDIIPDVVVQWRERADRSSITQQEHRLEVLAACLDAMQAGLRVLDGTGHAIAADARVGQMLRMDVPRLAERASAHPDDAYRRRLGRFTRELWERADRVRARLDDETLAVLAAARLW